MPSLFCALLLVLSLASLLLASPSPQTTRDGSITPGDRALFNDLLNSLPEESLHSALDNHMPPKYQEGVFEYHKAAVEKVHDDNPDLASKLVIYAAKLELMKRQNTNSSIVPSSSDTPPATSQTPPPESSLGTTPSPSPSPSPLASPSSNLPSSSSPAPSLSSSSPFPLPPPGSSLASSPPAASTADATTAAPPASSADVNNPGSSAAPESSALPVDTPSITIEVPVTTTDAAGQVIVTSTPRGAIVFSTTNSAGQTIAVTTPSPTQNQPITMTDSKGSTFVTTYSTPKSGGGGGAKSSLVILTRTLPNGKIETVTSYTIVGGDATDGAANTDATPTNSRGTPSLQSGAANVLSRQWGVEAAALMGGAVGVAWFM